MRKIIVGEYLSLDGVMESPEKWTFSYFNDEVRAYLGAVFATSDALLLGRVTYETFAASFASQSDAQSEVMNQMQKYVASTTMQTAHWNNSTLLTENVPEAISELKQRPGKNMTVSGSGMLVQTLIDSDLVDEYSLLVYPLVLGSGKHLFLDSNASATLRLIEAKPFSNGVVLLRYQPARAAQGA